MRPRPPGQEAMAAASGLPLPTPEATLRAPGLRRPNASHPVSLPRARTPHTHPLAHPALPSWTWGREGHTLTRGTHHQRGHVGSDLLKTLASSLSISLGYQWLL